MLPIHNEPVIHKNTIAKILFASCSAKISYRENFCIYGSYSHTVIIQLSIVIRHVPVHISLTVVAAVQAVFDVRAVAASVHVSLLLPRSVKVKELYAAAVCVKQ